jgi:hypothetical protein
MNLRQRVPSNVEYRRRLARARSFGPSDLERLFRLLARADEVVPLRDAVRWEGPRPRRLIALRHDMDRDHENAVRMARRESDAGIRGSYYVLHDDWYARAKRGPESRRLLRSLERIADLGHEIGLHNNAIADAFRTGIDPVAILDRELTYLRKRGFTIIGTAAHGDPLSRSVGFRNNEIFRECSREDFGDPDRTLVHVDPDSGARRELALRPIPMAELGLEYEAYFIGHDRNLSDVGGRWHSSFTDLADEFTAGPGMFLQILVHPLWWAFEGERLRHRARVSEPRAAATKDGRRDGSTLRIIVRGDCCSRRAVNLNRDLFGGAPEMIRDEKSRTDFLLDHLTVGSATRQDILRYMDVDAMKNTQRHYALSQTDRCTMSVTDADLLVMDNYADMNFQAWRNREKGWTLWINPRFLRDREGFERDFERLGRLTLDDSIELHVKLIEHYRSLNGPIPVLYLNQPIGYYRQLEARRDFYALGAELELAVPDVYAGHVDDSELEPDDMNSSGPGQTLHFTAATYRKMIELAMEKGAGEWLRGRRTISRV